MGEGTVSFPISKTKALILVIGSLVFIAVGVSLWLLPDVSRALPRYGQAAAAATLVFFGLCTIHGLLRLFDRRPGLILDRQGLIDHSGTYGVGRVAWSEIRGIHVTSIYSTPVLTLEVRNPEKFLGQGDALRRYFTKERQRLTGSPVYISSTALNANFRDMSWAVVAFWRRYGEAAR